MTIPIRRPLVLDSAEFRTRADNFTALMNVAEFQDRFFADPSGTTAEEFGLQVETLVLSRSNRLTYALLSDPEFVTWSADFQARAERLLPAAGAETTEIKRMTAQLQEEFRASVQEHLSRRNAGALQNLNDVQLVAEDDIAILLIVFLVLIVVAAREQVSDNISRKTIQDLLRQLDQRHVEQVRARREALDE